MYTCWMAPTGDDTANFLHEFTIYVNQNSSKEQSGEISIPAEWHPSKH